MKGNFNIRLGFTGLILSIIGLNILILQSSMVDYALRKILIIAPDSLLFNLWRKTPLDISTNFYYFNWTNKDDFYNSNVKPKFQEVGPYKLRQTIERVNITWNDNHTVSFGQVHNFDYAEVPENENFDDEITTINFIFMATAHYVRNWSSFMKILSNSVFESFNSDYYITKTAGEQTLGFENTLVDLVHYVPYFAPEIPRFDKFGWMKFLNGDIDFDRTLNLANGENRNFDLQSWNYNNKTPYFNGSCNEVKGSLGDIYSFNQNKNYLDLFIPELCRSVRLDFEKEEEVDGILGYKYSVQDSLLDNGTKIPGNECFCAGDCIPSGLLNISSCKYGINVYGSLPHFYSADPIYLNGVEGLHPKKSKHESYIIVEPVTMLPLKFKGRLQVTLHIHPVDNFRVFENAPSVYFPVMWIEEEVQLPNEIAKYLKIFLSLPMIITSVGIIVMISGISLIFFVVYKVYIKTDNTKVYDLVIPEKVPLKFENVNV